MLGCKAEQLEILVHGLRFLRSNFQTISLPHLGNRNQSMPEQNPGAVHESRPPNVQIGEKGTFCMITECRPIYDSCNQCKVKTDSKTHRLYSQWLNSVINCLINHCTYWARTGDTSFDRQLDFHVVIYHIWHYNVDNRRCNVVFTTT